MNRAVQVGFAVVSMLSLTTMETVTVRAADDVSIGTASVRGDFRVDGHTVRGNATIFNGSIIETGTATADLRMDKGAAITMSSNSRGTLYSDRLVLQQGESELKTPESFHLEADGLLVASNGLRSQGIVSLNPGNKVQVSSLSGTFDVKNGQGLMLASVSPGRSMTFALQANSGGSVFEGTGKVSFSDGNYYLTLKSTGVKYDLKGDGLSRLVGKEVTVTGKLENAKSPPGGSVDIVDISRKKIIGAGLTSTSEAIIAGVIVIAGVGTAVGVYEANQSSQAASR